MIFFYLAHFLHYTNTQLLSAIYLTTIDCDVNGSLRTQQLTHVLLTVLNKPLEKQTYQSFQVDLFVLNRC